MDTIAAEGAAFAGAGPLGVSRPAGDPSARARVLAAIRAHGSIARVDLARELAISPASVTAITGDLLARGLIGEQAVVREAEAGRGRPPVALAVRSGRAAVAGVKLSDRQLSAVILDFAGRRLGSSVAEADGRIGADGVAEAVADLVVAAAGRAGLAAGDLAGIGVGLPGVVDTAGGEVLWSPVLEPGPVPMARLLAARLVRPVWIDNDANMLTLAELWYGAGRSHADFAVVTIEHGVGMGLVLDRRLYRGATGKGMEIGHTKLALDGAPCRCGRRGCLEAYVADYALLREARAILGADRFDAPRHQALADLAALARAGDPAAQGILAEAGRYLALGLSNIVNFFDPSLIILSGERMRHGVLAPADLEAQLAGLALGNGRSLPEVAIHPWPDTVWAQGAAAMALEHVSASLLEAP